jgi:hypothetical protein
VVKIPQDVRGTRLTSTTNPVCERRVNLLVCSLPLHRHSYIGFILAFASSIHNKQRFNPYWSPITSTLVYRFMINNSPTCTPSLCYSLTHAHRSIGYRNRNPQPLADSATRLMYLRVYDNRDSSHQSAPSPSLSYSLTHAHSTSPHPHSSRWHALRYFGFLSVWPGLQFPAARPLGLGLLYVYPRNPVCARRFRSSCFSV